MHSGAASYFPDRMTKSGLRVDGWTIDRPANRIRRVGEERRVEPKVMDLLALLASRPGQVFSQAEIRAALWPATTVNEDSLARYVFKLRRLLDDDPKAPRLVETIPKRGYRLRQGGAPDSEAETLRRRAEEFYFQFTRADNEAAIALYQRALRLDPSDAAAGAGLANGLIQRALRWLEVPEGAAPRRTLGEGLASGVLETRAGRALLDRAEQLALAAAASAPDNVQALRAAGLALAAGGRLDEARGFYERALRTDPGCWGALISLADLDGLQGREAEALEGLERAYAAMDAGYEQEAVLIRPWHAELGAAIGERHRARGDLEAAAAWHRRVLDRSPLHEAAMLGLARVLADGGDAESALALCRELQRRLGPSEACGRLLAELQATRSRAS